MMISPITVLCFFVWEKGANLEARDYCGRTLLDIACEKGNEVLEELLVLVQATVLYTIVCGNPTPEFLAELQQCVGDQAVLGTTTGGDQSQNILENDHGPTVKNHFFQLSRVTSRYIFLY